MPKGNFYKITKAGKTSYLFGTLHSNDPKVTQLSLEVTLAFEHSDRVIFEMTENDMSNAANANTIVANLAQEWCKIHSNRKPLFDILHEDGALASFVGTFIKNPHYRYFDLDNLGRIINNYPPVLLAQQLPATLGSEQFEGDFLELALVKRANQSGKPVFGLENLEDKFRKLHGLDLNYEEQVKLFYCVWKQNQQGIPTQKNKLTMDAYLVGDLASIIRIHKNSFLNGEDFKEYHEVFEKWSDGLLDQTDGPMATTMQVHLDIGNAFFAVGAGHLNGIIGHLLAAGCTVEKILETPRIFPISSIPSFKDPKLPESSEKFETQAVSSYSQILTQYLGKYSTISDQETANPIFDDDKSVTQHQRYKMAKHIFQGKYLTKDANLGKTLLKEVAKEGYEKAQNVLNNNAPSF